MDLNFYKLNNVENSSGFCGRKCEAPLCQPNVILQYLETRICAAAPRSGVETKRMSPPLVVSLKSSELWQCLTLESGQGRQTWPSGCTAAYLALRQLWRQGQWEVAPLAVVTQGLWNLLFITVRSAKEITPGLNSSGPKSGPRRAQPKVLKLALCICRRVEAGH